MLMRGAVYVYRLLCVGPSGNSGGPAVAPLRGNTGVSLESQKWADVGC